ncbi:hypothetical protein FN846DRAFT_516885 [Sphaerosporella brunnea]|uniref:C2H2-type domain-containing protein n=1 Tax=Sphaerosporella brunnea TaxID=1250544 RepID=A0A5J5F365_9PEZI|nr:hypothetical protein FN846DRAFT_516885 [Sphaerosporella brunnea]
MAANHTPETEKGGGDGFVHAADEPIAVGRSAAEVSAEEKPHKGEGEKQTDTDREQDDEITDEPAPEEDSGTPNIDALLLRIGARLENLCQEKDQWDLHTPVGTSDVLKGDEWLDTWNLQIFRCTNCNRPFGTSARLRHHSLVWHSPWSPKIDNYTIPDAGTAPDDSGKLLELMKDGDLKLLVRRTLPNRGFLVSSQVLCMTSKVFQKMCGRNSPFKEAAAVRRSNTLGGSAAVVWLEDDVHALEFILAVLHHRHDLVPAILPFSTLVNVAGVCDKYEFHSVLSPMMDKYLEDPYKTSHTACGGHEDWLFVSYVFGKATVFTRVSKELILSGCYNGKRLEFVRFFGIRDGLCSYTPHSILDKLQEKRQNVVEKIRHHVESLQAEWCHFSGEKPRKKCKRDTNTAECEALLLGHLMCTIAVHHLDQDETWSQSLRTISSIIMGISNFHFPAVTVSGKTLLPHLSCSWVPELQFITDSCINSVEGLKLSDFPSSQRNL